MSTSALPANDADHEIVTISGVSKCKSGWNVTRSDGWCYHVPADSPVEPKAGMTAVFYPAGIGHAVRGLFLDGVKVFYRTQEEERQHFDIQFYGADAKEWLRRWDAGANVWSIEMGGLGPGYEQAIQITVAEIVRELIAKGYDANNLGPHIDAIRSASHKNEILGKLGLSGAQFGAALSLATSLYKRGPRELLNDPKLKDRHIQVSRNFPTV